MKKIISMLMAAAMVFSMSFALTSCGDKKEDEPESKTVAKIIFDDFKNQVDGKDDVNIEDVAAALVKNDIIQFKGATIPVEPGYLNGFTEEISGFEKGVMFGPVIGSIPFVGYIFEISPEADADTFMQTLKDKSDLRWNICTEADEKLCEKVGNYVLFIMSPTGFEQDNDDNGDDFIDFAE